MKERPILMNAPMVRAILAGTKTQTRRVVKPQPTGFIGGPGVQMPDGTPAPLVPMDDTVPPFGREILCPYGQPGDRLWVRETWHGTKGEPNVYGNGCLRYYRADYEDHPAYPQPFRWTPSIHMPRWASRITLEVTGVRVERLQAISEADAVAEGWPEPPPDGKPHPNPVTWYKGLWEEINGPGSWDANPWVWCVEFKRLEAA